MLKLASLYFLLVFGTGFVLGSVRVLWFVPRFGARTSELLEMPLMFVAILLAAGWINHHFGAANSMTRLWIGIVALGFLLTAEVVTGVALRGLSPAAALFNRDPVSGTAYYLLLVVFALMPWLLDRRRKKKSYE